ncbi:MAG: gliding motility-associated C-terminal domain-containing protein [Bacteroidota bacterium]
MLTRQFFILCLGVFLCMQFAFGQGPLTISVIDEVDASCTGLADGFARVQGMGGTPPYAIDLNFSGQFTQNNSFSDLPAGTHTIRMIDNGGNSTTTTVNIGEPLPLEVQLLVTDATCSGGSDGAITMPTTGGNGNFSYYMNGSPIAEDSIFENLSAGFYEFVIEDILGCQLDTSLFVNARAPIDGFFEQVRDVDCQGNQNGSFRVNVNGGWGDYRYSVNGQAFQASPVFQSLNGGNYQVAIVDSNGCTHQMSIEIEEPDQLVLQTDVVNVDCYEGSTGSLSFTGKGGVLPYAYAVNGGNFSFESLRDRLSAGLYKVQAKDGNGCLTAVETYEIDQGEEFLIGIQTIDVVCKEAETGEAQLSITGGLAPYQISWNGEAPNNDLSRTNLPAGLHFVSVTDQFGCEQIEFFTIDEPADGMEIMLAEAQASTCGQDNGILEISTNPAVGPYTYTWTGLPQETGPRIVNVAGGLYEVSVENAAGCLSTFSYELEENKSVEARIGANPQIKSFMVLPDGNLTLTNQSVGATSFSWDFGDGSAVSNEENPVHTYDEEGTFTLTFIASDATGTCSDTLQRTFSVIPVEKLEVADSFTPNGDGINDIFKLGNPNFQQVDMVIVDRWGRPIRRILPSQRGWDGKDNKGIGVAAGTYAYTAQVRFSSGGSTTISGTILLLR